MTAIKHIVLLDIHTHIYADDYSLVKYIAFKGVESSKVDSSTPGSYNAYMPLVNSLHGRE